MKTDIRYFGAAPVHVTQPQHIASCFCLPQSRDSSHRSLKSTCSKTACPLDTADHKPFTCRFLLSSEYTQYVLGTPPLNMCRGKC